MNGLIGDIVMLALVAGLVVLVLRALWRVGSKK